MSGADLMRSITSAFEEGDVKPLMAAIHPDVIWKSASKCAGLFSFAGTHKDRVGVVEVLAKVATRYTFTRFQAKEIVEQGEVVWGVFDTRLLYRPRHDASPKSMTVEMALRWRIRDGKIVEHQAFFDTAYMLVQQGVIPEIVAA
jgi:ketosteroid isomerase-like protein